MEIFMKESYFMGIDTGTNSSKGVLINSHGEIIAEHTTEHAMTNPAPGHYEHDADKDWWGDLCIISNALIEKSKVSPSDIKAIGTSALGADCLPVDDQCRPLRKAILYGIDARATDEIEQLTEMYGEEQIRQWYGRPLCSSDVMPKILWIKNKEPDIYAKTHKFLTGSRACLKNHFRNLQAPLCGIFYPHSVAVARYDALIRIKSPTN